MARSRRKLSYPVRASQSVIANRRLDGYRRMTSLDMVRYLQNRVIQRNLFAQNETARLRSLARDVEDRRRFHPEGVFRPARDRKSRVARVGMLSLLGSAQNFVDPFSGHLPVRPSAPRAATGRAPSSAVRPVSRQVLICVRRKARREVLFARGVGGGRVSRRRRRTFYSDVHC